jgi:hypothetical protein
VHPDPGDSGDSRPRTERTTYQRAARLPISGVRVQEPEIVCAVDRVNVPSRAKLRPILSTAKGRVEAKDQAVDC